MTKTLQVFVYSINASVYILINKNYQNSNNCEIKSKIKLCSYIATVFIHIPYLQYT